ncbi:Phthiocerol synthesis polyketide synthase type I PpsC [Sulfitobacter sp. THAF37]|uniref:NADPH:quinone reductase n=1 Tax=Sulfitobacter sp. THAF37 TaxID=2587855 RepID=UPI001267B3F2|nr:NADPH:quinone reductase [Sulfitobacter sp. THAF37]QFT58888.1 Phthiocerol synthesis polyketide synthase type I PpsC [Sulfitobacter sp. THAF37]
MRAITYEKFGPAREVLRLQEIDSPAPGPGEVRVRLALSGVNPSDVKARAGTRPGVTKPAFPLIVPHSDGAGEIEAVGAGVDPARIGQGVWIWNGQWQRSHGTAASHITLPAQQAVPLPNGVDFDVGASLGIPGLTACHAVFGGGDVAGETVLVQGGAGTVGRLAVQLAKWGGARVIATCSAADRDRVVAAGADAVFDYGAGDLAAQVLDANDGMPVGTVVEVEFGLNIAADTALIAANGRLAAYGSAQMMEPTLSFGPLLFKAVTIDIILIYLLRPAQRARAIDRLHHALADGALDCPTERILPLAETAAAHEAVEKGGRNGAILVDCQG